MLWIVIEGLKPYDGRYPFDNSEFTVREWGWIREFTGYLPLTIDDGYDGGDPALHTALAVIMLHRAGRVATSDAAALWERLSDLTALSVFRLENDAAEDDADPPELRTSGNGASSGAASPISSETSTGHPQGSGTPASATSPSEQPTLVTSPPPS